MGTIIYRGSTPTIKFKPLNNVTVSDLGTPSIAIAQELVYLTPEVTVNTDENSISAKLTEEESLSLVEGVPTSAQQIWVQENGNIVRYPVHQLTVAETIMEEVNPEPEPEPTAELVNLHPFLTHSPFENNGYFTTFMDDGGTAVENWNIASTPWNEHVDDYLFVYDATDAIDSGTGELDDFTMIPLCVADMAPDKEYYLWVNSPSGDELTINLTIGNGYAFGKFSSVSGTETYAFALAGGSQLIKLVANENALFNEPLFQMRVRTPAPTKINKIGMALYQILPDLPDSEYKRYIPYQEGGA